MESKMPNPTRIEINCETGVESIIELTDAEVAEMEAQAAQAEVDRVAREEAAQALAALKASAKAKLIAGTPLTAEEADTLVL
jgi:formylmethanofuran dehydrogenase subunit B